jgi:hypothetical protein
MRNACAADVTYVDLFDSSDHNDMNQLNDANSKDFEDGCLLGCSAMQSGRSVPTFQRSLLPPSSLIALMMKAASTSETLVIFCHIIQSYNPDDSHFLNSVAIYIFKHRINKCNSILYLQFIIFLCW